MMFSLLSALQALIPIVAIIAVFGTPALIFFISKYFKALEKGLVGRRNAGALPEGVVETIAQLQHDRMVLESRIRSLETTVLTLESVPQRQLPASSANSPAASSLSNS